MNTRICTTIISVLLIATAGCDTKTEEPAPTAKQVETSGKLETDMADVPAEVLQAARKARPDLTITETEYEEREGRQYYDVGGTLSDGSELELDMMLKDGTWQVMEIQRDIEMADVPEMVAAALAVAVPGWSADRIIESDQGDGVVIYEFFGGDPVVKHEIKLEDGMADLLTEEWAH